MHFFFPALSLSLATDTDGCPVFFHIFFILGDVGHCIAPAPASACTCSAASTPCAPYPSLLLPDHLPTLHLRFYTHTLAASVPDPFSALFTLSFLSTSFFSTTHTHYISNLGPLLSAHNRPPHVPYLVATNHTPPAQHQISPAQSFLGPPSFSLPFLISSF